MDNEKIQEKVACWLKGHQKEFGIYDEGRFSIMLALDTYSRGLFVRGSLKGINFKLKEELIKIFNTEFVGDLIQIAVNWSLINKYCSEVLIYENVIENITKSFEDKQNRMDNIDKILCYSLLNLSPEKISEVFTDAMLELSNVLHWKYEVVQKPIYYRKIHNSFHYATPYILLYNLSKEQKKKSVLRVSDERRLDKVFYDAYKNFSKLNILDKAFLLSASPIKYEHLIYAVMEEYISEIQTRGFENIPFYYDNVQFGTFIGAKTYTASMVCESLETAGNFEWSPFLPDEIIPDNDLRFKNSYLEKSGIMCYPRKCRMKMKEQCMSPSLKEGDEIDVLYDVSDISIGDIIVFRHYSNKIMAHRVIDIMAKGDKSAIITAADNGGLWGYPVFKKDIVGKVVGVYRNG